MSKFTEKDVKKYLNDGNFCIAPWVHIQNTPEGVPQPCCIFKPNIIDGHTRRRLNDAFHGEEWDKLRQRFLNGEQVKECDTCYNKEWLSRNDEKDLNTATLLENISFREHLNHMWKDDMLDLLNKPQIRDVDLAISNKCNFKCVDCGNDRSSAWYKEEYELDKFIPRVGAHVASFARQTKPDGGQALIDSFDYADVDWSKIKTLRCIGGEPLIDNRYHEIMERIDIDNAEIIIVSNGSRPPTKKWTDKLDRAKKVLMMFSIDGVGELGEYVRYGLNMRRFTRNLQLWIDYISNHRNPESKFRYHYVAHNMNMLNIQKTYDYLSQWFKPEKNCGHFDLSFLHRPEYLNSQYLPRATKDWILEQVKGELYEERIKLHFKTKEYNEDHIDKFFIFSDFLEKNRKTLPEEIETLYLRILKDHQNEKRNK